MKKICVIGSINMDLVTCVNEFPRPGETVCGFEFKTHFGGKGANQAVALGKLGADVLMVGKLGNDSYADEYEANFKNNGVNMLVSRENDISTGIAVIQLNQAAQNSIVVVPGANDKVDISYIDSILPKISEYDIFLFQLEIPMKTVAYAVNYLSSMGKTIILDPAPAKVLPDELLAKIDYITPNETELETISGIKVNGEEDLKKAAQKLLDAGVKCIIAKAGNSGAYLINKTEFIHVLPYAVNAIDTTAAGDSFNAGFAYAIACDMSPASAAKWGNAVGGLATEGIGAQSAMPEYEKAKKVIGDDIL